VEQLIAREPAWRAAHEAARIAALLQREQAWQAAQVEQARQQLTTASTMYREMDMRFWLEQAEGTRT